MPAHGARCRQPPRRGEARDVRGPKARDGKTTSRYFDDNYDLILRDLAEGGGAYVDVLGRLFACPERFHGPLARILARKLKGRVLERLDSPDELQSAVARLLRTRKVLIEQCRNLPAPLPASALPAPPPRS